MTKLLPLLLLASLSVQGQKDTVQGVILFPGVMTSGYLVTTEKTTALLNTWFCIMGNVQISDTGGVVKVRWLPFSPGTVYDSKFRSVDQRAVRAFYVPTKEQPKLGF